MLDARPSSGPKESPLTVSVVICTRRRPQLLEKCLSEVAQLTPRPNEVLVVDNSEGDAQTQALAQQFSARYVVEPHKGLSHARNRGMAECDCEIATFIDDDAVPAPDWLGSLLKAFADERVAAATGRVVTPKSKANEETAIRSVCNQDPYWFEMTTFGGMGFGSNMALRKGVCGAGPLFDERLGRGAPFQIGEESFALARLVSCGYLAVYVPTAVVFHPPMRRDSIEQEATNSMCYWLLLFERFPKQRLALLRFLLRRIFRRPLRWPRDPQEPGEIVTSGLRVLGKASIKALWLFFRTPKPNS